MRKNNKKNHKSIKEEPLQIPYLYILLFLTIVGAILRFYNLWYNSLWLDEASTLTIASKSIPDIWQITTAGEFNPPLFYWIEHIMLIFGSSEIILRIVPAIMGVLTIPAIYFVGKEFMDSNTGIIAATAFTFSPFLIFYSQEARAYSMMLFFVACAMIFYLRAIKDNTVTNWAAFGIFSALSFWSHFYAMVIIGSLVLYAVYILYPKFKLDRNNMISPIAGMGLFSIICLPLILVTIQLFLKRTESAPTFGIQGPAIIIATFQQISGSDIAMYVLTILFIIGIVQMFRMDKKKGIFLTTLVIMSFVISNFLSYKMPMQPRYLIFLSIVFFISIALSYRVISEWYSTTSIVYGFMIFLIVINVPTLMTYYSGYTKENWRGFSNELQQITQQGDIVVVIPGYISQPLDYYYSNVSDKTIELSAYTSEDLKLISAQKNNNTIYYVMTSDIMAANPQGDAIRWLEINSKGIGQETGIYLLTTI